MRRSMEQPYLPLLAAFQSSQMLPGDIHLLCQLLLCHPLNISEFLQTLSECFLVKIHVLSFPKRLPGKDFHSPYEAVVIEQNPPRKRKRKRRRNRIR